MQIGSNEVAEFYRINTFKDFVCSRLFIGRPSFTTTMVWTFKSTFVSGIIYVCPLPKSFTVIGPTLGPTSTPLEALDELWEALQCLPMQGWVVQRSLQWYHLSSSNLKLFLVWTQLCQAGKLFFLHLHSISSTPHITWQDAMICSGQAIGVCTDNAYGIACGFCEESNPESSRDVRRKRITQKFHDPTAEHGVSVFMCQEGFYRQIDGFCTECPRPRRKNQWLPIDQKM